MSSTDTLQKRIQTEIAELTGSISEVVIGFRKLQRPLVESRDQVPQATNQLDKITEQTEAVTTRMLDVVEQLTQREEKVMRGLETIRKKVAEGDTTEIDGLIEKLLTSAGDNLNDGYQIMESLQFQDITAQQMDHAASLLEDVEVKLRTIVESLGAAEGPDPGLPSSRKARAYDPHADLVEKRTGQDDIDSIFANGEK